MDSGMNRLPLKKGFDIALGHGAPFTLVCCSDQPLFLLSLCLGPLTERQSVL